MYIAADQLTVTVLCLAGQVRAGGGGGGGGGPGPEEQRQQVLR